jgi:hypothetical protein
MTRSEKPKQMIGEWAASGQRGAAGTYTQYVVRLRRELADLRSEQDVAVGQDWPASLRDRIQTIEFELKQLGEKVE